MGGMGIDGLREHSSSGFSRGLDRLRRVDRLPRRPGPGCDPRSAVNALARDAGGAQRPRRPARRPGRPAPARRGEGSARRARGDRGAARPAGRGRVHEHDREHPRSTAFGHRPEDLHRRRGALSAALHDALVANAPGLAAQIKSVPPLNVSIRSKIFPELHDPRSATSGVAVLATVAALLLITASLLLRHDRRSFALVGRRIAYLAITPLLMFVVLPRVLEHAGHRARGREHVAAHLRRPRPAVGDRARARRRVHRVGRFLWPQPAFDDQPGLLPPYQDRPARARLRNRRSRTGCISDPGSPGGVSRGWPEAASTSCRTRASRRPERTAGNTC